jgi:hypothetical protein
MDARFDCKEFGDIRISSGVQIAEKTETTNVINPMRKNVFVIKDRNSFISKSVFPKNMKRIA